MSKAAPADCRQLADEFMAAVLNLPGGENIKRCLQCGTCSGACPTSYAMDYTPREIIAALRAGMLDRILGSNTVWMCSSCYGCTARCPSAIKLTDVMYELKSLSIKHGVYPRRVRTPALQEAFVAEVEAHGRSGEVGLMRRFFLSTNPFNGLKHLPLALALYRRGRLRLKGDRVSEAGRQQLKAIAQKARGE